MTADASGSVLEQRAHYPYGETWYEGGGTSKWKFTTYERDSESGNDYAIFRVYVSRFGRFCSGDPVHGQVADAQSWNRYAYVRNDPVNLRDPLGLDWKCDVECIHYDSSRPPRPEECRIVCEQSFPNADDENALQREITEATQWLALLRTWDDMREPRGPGGGPAEITADAKGFIEALTCASANAGSIASFFGWDGTFIGDAFFGNDWSTAVDLLFGDPQTQSSAMTQVVAEAGVGAGAASAAAAAGNIPVAQVPVTGRAVSASHLPSVSPLERIPMTQGRTLLRVRNLPWARAGARAAVRGLVWFTVAKAAIDSAAFGGAFFGCLAAQ